MARKIVWTDPAAEDLEAAVEFIAKDSEAYAADLAQLAWTPPSRLRGSPTGVQGP